MLKKFTRLLGVAFAVVLMRPGFVVAQTNFPNGVSSYGIPLLGNPLGTNIPNLRGKVWFVDGTNGTNGSCLTPAQACRTIGAAVTKAGDGNGDTIIVYPGSYEENIVVSKDYITIECAQNGYAKPDVVPASGVALTVSGQGFRSICMRYAAPAADVDLITHSGNGFFYINNVFDGDATQGNAKALIRLKGDDTDDSKTASEGVILGNLFRGSGGDGIIFDTAEAAVGVGETDDVVAFNTFVEIDQIAIATADTGPGTYSIQRSVIGPGNTFEDKNKTTYIDLTTSNGGGASDQTGAINNNVFAADAITTTEVKMVGTGFTFSGNIYTVGIKDGSGLD